MAREGHYKTGLARLRCLGVVESSYKLVLFRKEISFKT
jgi:hypothetical protein